MKKKQNTEKIMKKKNKNMYELSKEEAEKRKKKEKLWEELPLVCKARIVDIHTGRKIIILHEQDAEENEIHEGYRVVLKYGKERHVAIVNLSSTIVRKGEIGIFRDMAGLLKVGEGRKITILHMERPASLEYIKLKMDGESLSEEKVKTIVDDLMRNRLAEPDIAMWISAMYMRGMDENETIALTKAIVESGDILDLDARPIVDKHCIGGVAGNRTTMVVVPIIAAAGIYMPKTSSRAITSPSGTADTMEFLAKVNFQLNHLRKMVKKARGCVVWGGGMNIAPADDKMIRIRYPLSLDPKGVLLASILAKKKSVGAQYVVIDIPIGRGAKIADPEKARELGRDFIRMGSKLGMKIEVLITDGSEPIGNGIGPALEAKDVLEVLEGNGPEDLRNKSCLIAGKLLEMVGKAKEGEGYDLASELINNGKALKKMNEIIKMQGGKSLNSGNIQFGKHKYIVKAKRSGKISHIDNKKISKIARAAGAPRDKKAGVYLYRLKGDRVKKGDILFDIYAESRTRLNFALKALDVWHPIEFERILLDVMG